jgi:hypothetical protein
MAILHDAAGGLVLYSTGHLDNHIFDSNQLFDVHRDCIPVVSRNSSGSMKKPEEQFLRDEIDVEKSPYHQ